MNQKISITTNEFFLKTKKKCEYLPNAKFRVINDVISHGKLGLVLRRVNGFNLSDNTALRHQDPTVLLGHIGQHRHHQGVGRPGLPETLGQPDDSLDVVSISGKKRHVGPTRMGHGFRHRTHGGTSNFVRRCHFWKTVKLREREIVGQFGCGRGDVFGLLVGWGLRVEVEGFI